MDLPIETTQVEPPSVFPVLIGKYKAELRFPLTEIKHLKEPEDPGAVRRTWFSIHCRHLIEPNQRPYFDGFISTSVLRMTLSGKSYRHACVEHMWRSPVIVQTRDRTGKTRTNTLTKRHYVEPFPTVLIFCFVTYYTIESTTDSTLTRMRPSTPTPTLVISNYFIFSYLLVLN